MEMKNGQAQNPDDENGQVKVSVVMSAYNPNRRHFIKAVESIINQTFTDWELIMCDDGSSEKYESFFEKVAAKDPRITLVRNCINSGLAVSLNKCVRKAAGKYIARMDDDDFSDSGRIQKQFEFLENNPGYAWVGCNAFLMDETGNWGERILPEEPKKEDFLSFSPFIHPAVMFKAEVLKENPYSKLRRGEDYELFMRLYSKGYTGYNLQEFLFIYREDSQTSSRKGYYYQMEEAGIRLRGFGHLGMLNIKNSAYVIKPLLSGFMPHKLRLKIKRYIGEG